MEIEVYNEETTQEKTNDSDDLIQHLAGQALRDRYVHLLTFLT
jgi:hypothetical protein